MPIGPHKTKKEKQAVVKTEMHKFKHGELHSGSKKGPVVKNRKQAIAISLKESGQSKPQHHTEHSTSEGMRRSTTEHNHVDFDRHQRISEHGHDTEHANINSKHGMLPFPDGSPFDDEGKQTPYGTHPAAIPHIPANHALKHGPAPAPLPAHRSSNYGHSTAQRHGHLRMSGHSGAHQIGKR